MKENPNQPTIPEGQLQDKEFDFNKADMDDIVFMHRNKAYGAYQLRRLYASNMSKAALIAILLFLLFINLKTIIRAFQGFKVTEKEHITEVELTDVRYVDAEKHLPEPPEMPKSAPKKAKIDALKPKVKKDKEVKEVPPPNLEEPKKEENETDDSNNSSATPSDGTDEAGQPEIKPEPPKPVSTGEPQKVLLQQPPSYSGGEKELLRFIYSTIRYPEAARDGGIEGIVYITFIVEKDGSITNVTIKQNLGGGCGTEAARVVRQMPKWVPGKLRGAPIRAMMTLPIEFKLVD